MKVTLVTSDGSRHEVDLRGGLWLNGAGQGLISVVDREPPDVIVENNERGSFNVPRIFVRKNKPLAGIRTMRAPEQPVFHEMRYTNIPPIG